jgi:DNA polymerase V
MGVPYFQIKDTLQKAKAVVFSGHIALYRDISRRVFEVVRQEVDTMEQYSIDEAFFCIPADVDPQAYIARIKDTVEQQIGIPISIGVAASKTQAKYASTIAKKTGGLHVCDEAQWERLVSEIKVEQIWGVGAGLAHKCKQHGIVSVADLLRLDTSRVDAVFGVVGRRLQSELAGVITSPVESKRLLQKSLMNSRSFSKTTQDIAILADAAAYHTRQIAAELRSMGAACTVLRLSIRTSRHGDFFLRGGSKEAVFQAPTADTFELINTAEKLLQELYEANVPYQKVGVQVGGIVLQDSKPATLFADTKPDTKALLQAMDALNVSAGRELLTVGSRLRTDAWKAKSETRSPAYTTRWKEVAVVSA